MIIPPILDPSRLEQTLSTGTLSLALTAQRELCVVQKAGGVPLEAEELMEMIRVGVERAREVGELVEARLREDWAQRVDKLEVV